MTMVLRRVDFMKTTPSWRHQERYQAKPCNGLHAFVRFEGVPHIRFELSIKSELHQIVLNFLNAIF